MNDIYPVKAPVSIDLISLELVLYLVVILIAFVALAFGIKKILPLLRHSYSKDRRNSIPDDEDLDNSKLIQSYLDKIESLKKFADDEDYEPFFIQLPRIMKDYLRECRNITLDWSTTAEIKNLFSSPQLIEIFLCADRYKFSRLGDDLNKEAFHLIRIAKSLIQKKL